MAGGKKAKTCRRLRSPSHYHRELLLVEETSDVHPLRLVVSFQELVVLMLVLKVGMDSSRCAS